MLLGNVEVGLTGLGWLGIGGRTVGAYVGCRRLEIQEPGPVVRRRDTWYTVRGNLMFSPQDWSNAGVESPHALQTVGAGSPAEVSPHLKTQRTVPSGPP